MQLFDTNTNLAVCRVPDTDGPVVRTGDEHITGRVEVQRAHGPSVSTQRRLESCLSKREVKTELYTAYSIRYDLATNGVIVMSGYKKMTMLLTEVNTRQAICTARGEGRGKKEKREREREGTEKNI